jgi:hypothetical protein
VREALDTDLDAYLDRELFIQPAEVKAAPVVERPADRLQGVLALASEEEQWLRTRPAEEPAENSKDLEGGGCPIPEHLKAKPAPAPSVPTPVAPPPPEYPWAPAPAPLPGLAVVPQVAQPGWLPPVAPAPALLAPRLGRWIAAGVVAGVSAASVLAAGVLWMVRDSLPGQAEVSAAYVPAGAVTAATPPQAQPVREPVLSVESSPLARQPEALLVDWSARAGGGSEGALPGPVTPGRRAAPPVAQPPAPVASPEPAPSQARTAPAAEKPRPRRQVEDPYLAEVEAEAPVLYRPPPAPAPAVAAKPTTAPPAKPRNRQYEDFDEDFAKELGFTDNAAARKAPEAKGPKAVWIPPDPSAELPEKLTPADIQKVVVANQPAIVSCIRRHKEALPGGQGGGKFVLRWFVDPTGSTNNIALETPGLRGTPLATCLEGLVRSWKFPRHRVQQQEPIRFPFTY